MVVQIKSGKRENGTSFWDNLYRKRSKRRGSLLPRGGRAPVKRISQVDRTTTFDFGIGLGVVKQDLACDLLCSVSIRFQRHFLSLGPWLPKMSSKSLGVTARNAIQGARLGEGWPWEWVHEVVPRRFNVALHILGQIRCAGKARPGCDLLGAVGIRLQRQRLIWGPHSRESHPTLVDLWH